MPKVTTVQLPHRAVADKDDGHVAHAGPFAPCDGTDQANGFRA